MQNYVLKTISQINKKGDDLTKALELSEIENKVKLELSEIENKANVGGKTEEMFASLHQNQQEAVLKLQSSISTARRKSESLGNVYSEVEECIKNSASIVYKDALKAKEEAVSLFRSNGESALISASNFAKNVANESLQFANSTKNDFVNSAKDFINSTKDVLNEKKENIENYLHNNLHNNLQYGANLVENANLGVRKLTDFNLFAFKDNISKTLRGNFPEIYSQVSAGKIYSQASAGKLYSQASVEANNFLKVRNNENFENLKENYEIRMPEMENDVHLKTEAGLSQINYITTNVYAQTGASPEKIANMASKESLRVQTNLLKERRK